LILEDRKRSRRPRKGSAAAQELIATNASVEVAKANFLPVRNLNAHRWVA
jgi:hypothetical protein